MITTNQKPTIRTHMSKKKQSKHNTKYSHQATKTGNKGRKKKRQKSKMITKMAIRTHTSIITLNVNGLNASTERHRLAEWIQKQDLYICCLQELYLSSRGSYKLKVREWKKVFQGNRNQKKA